MILEVSSAMLKRLGYSVTIAQDGAEAIGRFRHACETGEPFDAVSSISRFRAVWEPKKP